MENAGLVTSLEVETELQFQDDDLSLQPDSPKMLLHQLSIFSMFCFILHISDLQHLQ